MAGKELEHSVFEKLQLGLENICDVVIFSSWEVCNSDDKKVGEFDFLIISLQLRAVIHVEVKRQLDERSLNKALEQLSKAENLFWNSVPFPVNEKWSYLKFAYFEIVPEIEFTKLCLSCKSQLMHKSTRITEWWKQVKQSSQSNSSPPPASTYLGIIKFILYHMLAQGNVITTGTTLFILLTLNYL